jgi:MerR family transcriptional regulator, light-induced transcriptional regulator
MDQTEVVSFQEVVMTQKEIIAMRVVDLQYARNPAYWECFGAHGRRLSIRDAGYHLPFLVEAVVSGEAEVFTDYVLWVRELFRGLNFSDEVMIRTLECTAEAMRQLLDPVHEPLYMPMIVQGIQAMQLPECPQNSWIDPRTPLGQLARDYTDALLDADRRKASALILEAAGLGVSVQEIYLEVFQKSQYEIGRLWLAGKISVAREHYCSAATQTIMSQLYPFIFSVPRNGKKLVAACIGSELHEIGMRMVSDFFELDGWDTWFLGANSPVSSIVQAAMDHRADLIGLSVSMPFHRQLLRETIAKLRNTDETAGISIMIGGHALNGSQQRWQQFGADGFAANAHDAVIEGNALTHNC